MNERIKELVKLATTTNIVQCNGWEGKSYLREEEYFDKEKFAELIVKECVQTLIDNTPERYTNESAEEDWDKGYDRAMRDCVHHIQEHFGVEE